MEVNLIRVALPDFYEGVSDGISGGTEDTTCQMSDLAHGRREMVVDDDQIVVRIEGSWSG
jgi:hypothetical protein